MANILSHPHVLISYVYCLQPQAIVDKAHTERRASQGGGERRASSGAGSPPSGPSSPVNIQITVDAIPEEDQDEGKRNGKEAEGRWEAWKGDGYDLRGRWIEWQRGMVMRLEGVSKMAKGEWW